MARPGVAPLAAALLVAALCLLGAARSDSEALWKRQRQSRASGSLEGERCWLRRTRLAATPPQHPYASYPRPAVGAARGPRPLRPRRARRSDSGGSSSVEDTWEESNAFPLRQRARAGLYAPVPGPAFGSVAALYFSGGREQLLLRPGVVAELPRGEFTIEAWVKPEGGQSNPAIIAALGYCRHVLVEKEADA
ncbi:UNVERIFIED_CONTAM: hypothetical protein K2H54_027822 [Gekko kuhli]